MAIAAVVVNVLTVIADQGLQTAIERHPAPEARHLHTAFWLMTTVSVLMSALILLAAPLVVDLFDKPAALGPLRALAVNPLFYVLYSNQQAILRRDLRFDLLARRRVATTVVASALAVALAFAGAGPYALVGQQVGFTALFAGVLWTASSYRPRWSFSADAARELLGFSGSIAASNMLSVFEQNIDNAVVGATLPSQQLGFYTMAYRVRTTLTMTLFSAVTTVAVPMLGRVQTEVDRLREGVLNIVRLASTVLVPVLIVTSVAAPVLVEAVLGARWAPAIVPMAFLALAGIPQILKLPDAAMVAYGASGSVFLLQVGSLVVKVLGFVVGVQWGINGVAASILVTNIVWSPVPLLVLRRQIGLPLWASYRALVVPLVCAAAGAAAMSGGLQVIADLPLLLRAATIPMIGLVTYVAVLAVVDRRRLLGVYHAFRPAG